MVAYADLGGLGAKQGAPIPYDWAMPSLLPHILPWLAILILLMLKPNRCASAWWVLVPLALVAGVGSAPESVLRLLPSYQFEIFLELIGAAAFGLAAVWLLSGYLAWKHRALAFLGVLFAQAGFSLLAYAVRKGWDDLGLETLGMAMALGVGVLVISLALTLAGLACRRRYGALRLTLWIAVALVVIWAAVMGPFLIPAMIAVGGGSAVLEALLILPTVAGITFGMLLPFLVLSFVNRFYRERLKALLHLGGAATPPMISPILPGTATASRNQANSVETVG